MILAALQNVLLADTTLTGDVGDRITQHRRHERSRYPAVVLNQITCRPLNVLDGLPTDDSVTVEALVYSSDEAGGMPVLKRVGDRIRVLLEGVTRTAGGFYIHGCQVVSDIPVPAKPTDASANWIHRRALKFLLTVRNDLARS